MNQFFVQKGMIETLSRCQKEFEKNLKNKKIMFIYENKNRSIDKEEMLFPISCFYHLTGIKAFDKIINL
ncbi:MAG: PBECR4 domain-containing protein [Clostridia bacterium]